MTFILPTNSSEFDAVTRWITLFRWKSLSTRTIYILRNVDVAIDPKICLSAEVGLSGEIRPVNRIDQRISEAEKLGFDSIVISKYNRKAEPHKGIKTISVALIEEVYRTIFQ